MTCSYIYLIEVQAGVVDFDDGVAGLNHGVAGLDKGVAGLDDGVAGLDCEIVHFEDGDTGFDGVARVIVANRLSGDIFFRQRQKSYEAPHLCCRMRDVQLTEYVLT